MKKSSDIIRLPVISINEGKQIGTVKDLVIDASLGSVVALVIDDGSWYLGAKVLPFDSITGLGESAVVVESNASLLAVSTIPRMEELMSAGVKVIGTRILTKSGQMGGKVVEISIDENGLINSCEVEENIGERSQVLMQQIKTFGKDVLIVNENGEYLGGRPMESMSTRSMPNNMFSGGPDESVQMIEEKQRRYLIGKRANREILAADGSILIEQGGEITEENLKRIRAEDKIIALTMNLRKY